MKTLKEHIDNNILNEALKDHDKGIKQMLEIFSNSCSGVQSKLFKQKLNDADSVDIESIYDVLNEEEIEMIKKYVRPKPKCCYENSYKLADLLYNHDIKYVEGYLNMKGLPIEHAYNCIDGKYVDITIEIALGKNVKEDTYIKIGEFDVSEVRNVLLENGYYGNIYDSIFLKKYKETIK